MSWASLTMSVVRLVLPWCITIMIVVSIIDIFSIIVVS